MPAPGPSSTAPAGMLSTQLLVPEPQSGYLGNSATWRMRPPPTLADRYGLRLSVLRNQVSRANAAIAVDGGDAQGVWQFCVCGVNPDRIWMRACTESSRSGPRK